MLHAQGQFLDQAQIHVVVQFVLRVPGEFHRPGGHRIVVDERFEDLVETVADHLVHHHEIIAGVTAIRGNVDEAGHPFGYVENGVATQLALAQLDGEVGHVVVEQLVEANSVGDPDRHHMLEDVVAKVLVEPFALFVGELLFADEENLLVFQLLQHILVDGVELGAQLHDAIVDLAEQLARLAGLALELFLLGGAAHAGDPHLKEFILIVGKNPEEMNALDDGVAGVRRFLQHPFVEGKPAHLLGEIQFLGVHSGL